MRPCASAERTFSAAVDRALREFILRARAGRILDLAGSVFWEGDLAKMREDWAVRDRGRSGRGKRRGLLVDTSVWVEVFRKPSRIRLPDVIEFDEIVTCPAVVQEVLQGFRDESTFRTAREAMLAFPVVESPLRMEVALAAVDLFRRARRAGLTVRSGVDCLIAACAIRNGLSVLHRDRDFDALAKVSDLKAHSVET